MFEGTNVPRQRPRGDESVGASSGLPADSLVGSATFRNRRRRGTRRREAKRSVFWHNNAVIMTVRYAVGMSTAGCFDSLCREVCRDAQPRSVLVWLCRDRFPVDIALCRVVVFEAARQEHPLRACGQFRQVSLLSGEG